ncbi:MAG: acyltransferase family protein, partial [Bacteroidaceae bacterium]|nr:acyltransferase family protein [Bacteroidaceae bacterium]
MNKRIEFIDLAKGICILLIIMGHTGIQVDITGITAMRTPLYFALSGLFFKDYGGFLPLLVRKTNKILIPFLFF